jgi:hypothetical protein
MLVDYIPLGDDFVQGVEFLALERRHAAFAGDALFIG